MEEKEKEKLFRLGTLEAGPEKGVFIFGNLIEECSLEKGKGKQDEAKGGGMQDWVPAEFLSPRAHREFWGTNYRRTAQPGGKGPAFCESQSVRLVGGGVALRVRRPPFRPREGQLWAFSASTHS